MKLPFRHHSSPATPSRAAPSTGASSPSGASSSAALLDRPASPPTGTAGAHPWHHMQQDVDPDCVRDPGSDLIASWDLESAAAEEAYEQEHRHTGD